MCTIIIRLSSYHMQTKAADSGIVKAPSGGTHTLAPQVSISSGGDGCSSLGFAPTKLSGICCVYTCSWHLGSSSSCLGIVTSDTSCSLPQGLR